MRFFVLVFITSSINSCDSQGHGGISSNINESKKRGVFKSEYRTQPNPYVINDSLKIKVISAWVENQWAYGKFEHETIIIDDNYQLVIEVEPNTLTNYNLTWTIGLDGDRYIRTCGNNCLMCDFDSLPKQIEEWDVQNGGKLDSLSKKTIIGNFKIYKKNN